MLRYFLLACLLSSTPLVAQIYTPKFDVQGHRGARGLKPENTIPAFITALDSGVMTLEMDVVITKDRQVVLSHEPWMSSEICLDTTGNVFTAKDEKRYAIYDMTYAQVARFDCGSKVNERFPEQQKISVTKPLLRDVLIAVEDHIKGVTLYEVDYNIEIKSSPDGDKKLHPTVEEYSDLVYDMLDEYIPLERVVIQSFDFRVLRYWRKKHPEIRLAALVENVKSVDANLADLGFNPAVYSPYFKLITKEKVDVLHKRKIRVIPWTVNETSDMLSLKGMGVDGFITDYPDRARRYKMTLGMNVQKK
ncbi:glycerophosphodiester phosphodiesterase [Fulvivirgaceae bacterium PWU5]|uniref:Glycerophosphodiester phosphodiesterase n=1 Tax=Dawidia cretensis TaxID=2782350 RepID=A0AAP2GUT0_9BACT|nr:glycerophosphodiester phosphodiesterase [Dawidia cretensis]MBT1709395.1 glycerophosphodiester phosphodiesterase [Dawidia cretensis]